MKKTQNLTNQEKEEILQNYQIFKKYEQSTKKLRNASHLSFSGICSILLLLCAIVDPSRALNFLWFNLYVCGIAEAIYRIDKVRAFKKLVTKKMSLNQFNKLQKSGELKKWEQELNNSNIVVEEYKSEPILLNSKTVSERVADLIKENNKTNFENLEK